MRAMLTVAPQRAAAIAQKVRGVGAILARKGLGAAELQRAVKPILTSIKDIMRQIATGLNRYWSCPAAILSSSNGRFPSGVILPRLPPRKFPLLRPTISARLLRPRLFFSRPSRTRPEENHES